MAFQRTVNTNIPLAIEGDFASANARMSTLAGEGALVSGPMGLTVGRFGWVGTDGRSTSNFGTGNAMPSGFAARQMGTGLITGFLQESTMTILSGMPVTLHDEGDFWARVVGSTPAVNGLQAFANFADGSVSFGSAPAGTTGTGSIGATFTGNATGTALTVTAVTGLISAGDMLAGTGVPAGTTILNQASGTPGGAGIYNTSAATTAAGTVTSFGNVLNVTAANGILRIGSPVTGAGVPANTNLASQTSGATGGTGVYTLSVPATAYVPSTTLTTTGGIGTNFYARSAAAVGELVKISTWGKA